MARGMVTAQIDGETYHIGYLLTSEAVKLALEVAKRAAPIMGSGAKGVLTNLGEGGAENLMASNVNDFIKKLDLEGLGVMVAAAIEPAELEAIIQKLCSVAVPHGEGNTTYDAWYQGRPGHALKVAVKSFEVNCSDFFASAVSLGGLLKKKITTPAKTP